jgi:hypothetical protein
MMPGFDLTSKSFIKSQRVYPFVSFKKRLYPALLILLILAMVPLSGCIDLQTSKRLFFYKEEKEITYTQGTIAEVRHNFTGGLGNDNVQVMTQEEHFGVDNFYIGEGGADLYIWAQVHYGADTERRINYERTIDVSLYFIPEQGVSILRAHKAYHAPETGRFDTAEVMEQVDGAENGMWSLRVIGNGTASSTADVPFYDWFQVTVNGRYSTDSYNHNAPF